MVTPREKIRPSQLQMLPQTIKYLLIVNALLFVITNIFYYLLDYNLFDALALHQPRSEKFSYVQLITHLFMHANTLHIFLNMFVLWMFGGVLEHVWHQKKFLFYYFFTGAGAAALHLLIRKFTLDSLNEEVMQYLQNPSYEAFKAFAQKHAGRMPQEMARELEQIKNGWEATPASMMYLTQSTEWMRDFYEFQVNIPTVGASGSVYGVLLAFGVIFPNVLIYLYFLIPIKAKYFVIMIGLLQIYLGFFEKASSVANFAHLGGMIFGFLLLKFWGEQPKKFVKDRSFENPYS